MTARHVGDELYELLRGELSNRDLVAVNDHLTECEPCRQELVDVSLAHALLMSVSEVLAPELIEGARSGGSDLPPLRFLHEPVGSGAPEAPHGRPALPSVRPARGYERSGRPAVPQAITPGIGVPAGARRTHLRRAMPPTSAGTPSNRRVVRRRSGIAALVALVLAVATCLGVGAARLVQPSRPRALLTADLLPLPAAPTAGGRVTIGSNGSVTVTTSGLAPAPKGQHYEVWLVEPAQPGELPLGILPLTGTGRFSFPVSLWHYEDGVSISLQANGVVGVGVGMLSTIGPAHPAKTPPAARPTTHVKTTTTRGSHPHRSTPSGNRLHHSQTGRPSPTVSSASHTPPPAVQRLLGGGAPHLPAGHVIRVDTTKDGEAVDPASGICRDSAGACSLRAAVEVADASRRSITIRLPAGTYDLTLGSLEVTSTFGVTIVGAGAATTVITATGQSDRVLVVGRVAGPPARKTTTLSLEKLSVAGGTAPSGGRWSGLGGDLLTTGRPDVLELTQVHVIGGRAVGSGGGIFSNGQLWATSASFSHDWAGLAGGAVELRGAEAMITRSAFEGDAAGPAAEVSGGAVDDNGTALVLVYSSFADDSVSGGAVRGGALSLEGAAWLSDDAFMGDHASSAPASSASDPSTTGSSTGSTTGSTSPSAGSAGSTAGSATDATSAESSAEGGALYDDASLATIEASTFDADFAQAATAAGGAVYTSASLTIAASRFTSDAATDTPAASGTATADTSLTGGGGAVYDTGHLVLESSWLSRDAAEGDGGAVFVGGASLVAGCVISHDLASGAGGGIDAAAALVVTATTLSHDRAEAGGGLFASGSVRARGDAIVDDTATGASGAGGGILLATPTGAPSPAKLVLRRSTVAGNTAIAGAGIAAEISAGRHPIAYLYRSFVSGNDLASGTEQDCAGVGVAGGAAAGAAASGFVVSEGGNVAGDSSCDLTTPTDRQGPAQQAYWLASATGAVHACRLATYGSATVKPAGSPVVALAAAPGNNGYWEVTADGTVDNFGSAQWFGSAVGELQGATVTGFAVTLDGEGYWIVTSDGAVLSFGDAGYFGSARGRHIVAMARSVDGRGYWLLGAHGSVFAFGDAPREGQHTGVDAVAITATADGAGYWVATATGSVLAFGDATSFGGTSTKGVVGLLASPDGRGYLLVTDRGEVYAFGDAVGAHPATFAVSAAAAV